MLLRTLPAVMILAATAWAAPAAAGAADQATAAPDVYEARVYRDASGGELGYRLMKPAQESAK